MEENDKILAWLCVCACDLYSYCGSVDASVFDNKSKAYEISKGVWIDLLFAATHNLLKTG